MHKWIETEATGTHHLLNPGLAIICSFNKSLPKPLSVNPMTLKILITENINVNPTKTATVIFCHKESCPKSKLILTQLNVHPYIKKKFKYSKDLLQMN